MRRSRAILFLAPLLTTFFLLWTDFSVNLTSPDNVHIVRSGEQLLVQSTPQSSTTRVVLPPVDRSRPRPVGVSQHFPNGFALDYEIAAALHHNAAALIRNTTLVVDASRSLGSTKSKVDVSRCAFLSSNRNEHLRRFEYSHRRKRTGELTTLELYQAVKDRSDVFFEFSEKTPPLINHHPIQMHNGFNLSIPFGSWSTAFVPVDDKIHEMPNREREVLQHQILRHLRAPQRGDIQPPAYVALFRQAIASRGHVVSCSGNVFTSGGCLWEFHLPQLESVSAIRNFPLVVPLCDDWCKGYYHFTHEHLPRVAVVHSLLLQRDDAKLALSHSPTKFQRQFLTDVLGIPSEKIIWGQAVFGEVVAYPMPMRCGNTFTAMLHMIRQIVYDRLELGHGRTVVTAERKYRLLFAERKSRSRMPKNYDVLKDELMKDFAADFDFSTTTGDSSALQQIELFHQADVVVGPHGANIANMMWMRRGTHVLEMASWKDGNLCYYATATRINVTHHLVLHDKSKDGKYELEYSHLRQHVAHALRLLRSEEQ